jgi:hypothetical protein
VRGCAVSGPQQFAGSVIIEWPAPAGGMPPAPGVLAGWAVRVFDAVTGLPVDTVMSLTVLHAEAEDLVWAELVMFAGRDGHPLFTGTPVTDEVSGDVLTGAFPFVVAQMRVAAP